MKSSALLILLTLSLSASAEPIRLHPDNPHYFLFKNKPTILITSAEHYGAVVNPDFDYSTYLDALARDKLNYTRIFTGSYIELPGEFGIQKNTLTPENGRIIIPWQRSDQPGYAGGGNKFDLRKWDENYFRRLRDFIHAADKRGIVVEVTLFSSIYRKTQWEANPLNPANNINGTKVTTKRLVHTLEDGSLFEHQKRMVKKFVHTLNEFDNVIFEIQNEPWSDNGQTKGPINPYLSDWRESWRNRVDLATEESLAWQRAIAKVIQDEESDLPNKHLIAQNFGNFGYPIVEIAPAISILNFHYAYPHAASLNYGWDRVVGLDETGMQGSDDITYRQQAWHFILAGGGLFNNLDYSFTVAHPEGTDTNQAPGGGSPALRKQIGILKRFIESFDFVRMRPSPEVVVSAPGAFRNVLADSGRAYAIYLDNPLQGDLILNVPVGSYRIVWIDVTTEKRVFQELVKHTGGRLVLEAPQYDEDIALQVVSTG